jgi:hypothetical protein
VVGPSRRVAGGHGALRSVNGLGLVGGAPTDLHRLSLVEVSRPRHPCSTGLSHPADVSQGPLFLLVALVGREVVPSLCASEDAG